MLLLGRSPVLTHLIPGMGSAPLPSPRETILGVDEYVSDLLLADCCQDVPCHTTATDPLTTCFTDQQKGYEVLNRYGSDICGIWWRVLTTLPPVLSVVHTYLSVQSMVMFSYFSLSKKKKRNLSFTITFLKSLACHNEFSVY